MMFDFWSFYKGLDSRKNPFDNYWDRFPSQQSLRFKSETLSLLRENFLNEDPNGLANTIAVVSVDGADESFTEILLNLLGADWHRSDENIVDILSYIKDSKSVNMLYEVAIKIPDFDDMRSLAKKCIYALGSINTPEAIEKLKKLADSNDPIISERARFELDHI